METVTPSRASSDGGAQAQRGPARLLPAVDGEQAGELVAAHPEEPVAAAQRAAHGVGDAAQHAIAVSVAVGVVEELEAVDVAHDHGGGRPAVRSGQRLVEGRVVAEAGERVALGALAQRAQQLGGAQARGAVGGELLEQLDVVGVDDGRLGARPARGRRAARPGRRAPPRPASRPRRRADRRGWQRPVPRAIPTVKHEFPSCTQVRDRLEPGGAQDRRQRAGRERRPQAAARPWCARAARSPAGRGPARRSAARRRRRRRPAWRADVGHVAQQALGGRLRGQAAERLDARRRGPPRTRAGARGRVAQRLARLDVEHADGQPAGAAAGSTPRPRRPGWPPGSPRWR